MIATILFVGLFLSTLLFLIFQALCHIADSLAKIAEKERVVKLDPKPPEVILPKGCHYKEFPGGEVQVLRGKEVLREARNKTEMIHWLIREPL